MFWSKPLPQFDHIDPRTGALVNPVAFVAAHGRPGQVFRFLRVSSKIPCWYMKSKSGKILTSFSEAESAA